MKRENPPALFHRIGRALIPADDFAIDLLNTLRWGDPVEVLISYGRNRKRLRAYWAMLRACVNSTGCAPSAQALHVACKIDLGLVDYVMYQNGEVRVVPSSVAFGRMKEPEFAEYFARVEQHLAEQFGYHGGAST